MSVAAVGFGLSQGQITKSKKTALRVEGMLRRNAVENGVRIARSFANKKAAKSASSPQAERGLKSLTKLFK